MDGRNMGQNDPAGDGAEAERPSGEASSVTMEEFEEMLWRVITAPPKTYEEVKLGKRRRRDSAPSNLVLLSLTRRTPFLLQGHVRDIHSRLVRRASSIASPRSNEPSPR